MVDGGLVMVDGGIVVGRVLLGSVHRGLVVLRLSVVGLLRVSEPRSIGFWFTIERFVV